MQSANSQMKYFIIVILPSCMKDFISFSYKLIFKIFKQ